MDALETSSLRLWRTNSHFTNPKRNNPNSRLPRYGNAWRANINKVRRRQTALRKPALHKKRASRVSPTGRAEIARQILRLTSGKSQLVGIQTHRYLKIDSQDFRLALGKRLALEFRLAFAEVWHDRAIQHGETYRFEVTDQSIDEDRKISELDVRRRAAARASRISQGDHAVRNETIEADLANHAGTLQQLAEARETKIAALGKDVGSLRSNLGKVERSIAMRYEMPGGETNDAPSVSANSVGTSGASGQAESVRTGSRTRKTTNELAREHHAPTRTDAEAATLAAQLNVARADFMAKDARVENFEASVHLTSYEVGDERWSLAALDKQISRRREDSKLIPHRAARLDLRSLARINYSATGREQAAAEVEHLTYVRGEIVRQIEQRREPLVADRDLSREMVDVLENAYASEQRSRTRNGLSMPEPKYERHQINALEASAETLSDPKLLREVHEWEKTASKSDPEIDWEGRAVAREIISRLAVEEATGTPRAFSRKQEGCFATCW